MYKAKRLNMRIVNNGPQVWLKNKQSIKVMTWFLALGSWLSILTTPTAPAALLVYYSLASPSLLVF